MTAKRKKQLVTVIIVLVLLLLASTYVTINIGLIMIRNEHERSITINKVIDCAMVDDLIANDSNIVDHNYIKPKKKYLVCIKYHGEKYYFEGKKYYDYCKDKVSVKVEVTSYNPDSVEDGGTNIKVTDIIMEE